MMPDFNNQQDPAAPYTKVPNTLFDIVMGLVSSSEFKVISVVIRKTYGFQKEEDTISYSQFQKATGLARSNVIAAIDGALEKGFITRRDGKKYKGQEKIYRFIPPEPGPKLVKPVKKSTLDQLKDLM